MGPEAPRVRDVFVAAVKLPPEEWESFLKEACAGDDELCHQLSDLLHEHQQAGSFLDRPAVPRLATCALDPAGDGAAVVAPPEVPERDPGDGLKFDFLTPSEKPGHLGRLGHYEVIEVIGRGGMGVVLKAFDEKLHRVVAIKVMAPQLATSATARQRFAREAQAAAAVRDQHVIGIHAVEEADGLPYLVMEYVSGLSLQERLEQAGPLEPKEILRIGIQVATGLAAAHLQGLIHRDIKPANILLENGVQRVKITDFGLARAADDASLSQSGVVAGTPHYMAPEQAEGKPVDPRADLFSLGSVLYALCTGRAPFRASTTMAVLRRVCEDAPRPIREINPAVPDALVETIARLHAKDPTERFPSAAQVAELLSQQLAHLQQPALPPVPAPLRRDPRHVCPPLSRPRRWRYAAAAVLLLVGGLGLTEATGVTSLAATVIRVFTPDGTLVVEVDDPQVKVTIEGDGGLVITGAGPQEVRLKAGSYRLLAAKDGKALKEERVSISRGGKQVVKVSVEPTGLPHAAESRGRHTATVRCVAYSPDGKLLASGGEDSLVIIRDAETLRERARLRHPSWVWGMAFSPDGRQLVTTADGRIRLWDVKTASELPTFRKHAGSFVSVAYSPDGRRVLSGGNDNDRTMRLWDVKTGEELRRFNGHGRIVWSVAFSPDGRRALSGSADRIVRLWDLETGELLGRLEGHTGWVRCVAFSPDGRQALSGGGGPAEEGHWIDCTVRVWDLETHKELQRFEGHDRPVWSAVFLPDGRRVLSGGDPIARLWGVDSGKELRAFEGHFATINGVALSPDGQHVASASDDRTVRLWDVASGKELCRQ
jgi:WD40 repeat protein/tRNA A-37 threonylcarbamoyl transferase component Bud32